VLEDDNSVVLGQDDVSVVLCGGFRGGDSRSGCQRNWYRLERLKPRCRAAMYRAWINSATQRWAWRSEQPRSAASVPSPGKQAPSVPAYRANLPQSSLAPSESFGLARSASGMKMPVGNALWGMNGRENRLQGYCDPDRIRVHLLLAEALASKTRFRVGSVAGNNRPQIISAH
jgi:hypothetical protein